MLVPQYLNNIKNIEVLSTLNFLSNYILNNKIVLDKTNSLPYFTDQDVTSDDYLFSHCFKNPLQNFDYAEYQNLVKLNEVKLEKEFEVKSKALKHYLGLSQTGGIVLYPKNGYISWHHNGIHANGHMILFNYSIDGEGFFKYYNNDTKSVVTINDVIGWSVKFNYLPDSYITNDVFWHCVKTSNYRITIIFQILEQDIDRIKNLLF